MVTSVCEMPPLVLFPPPLALVSARSNRSITSLSMARTNDPNSATSQFFINLKNNEFLDHRNKTPSGWGYAVFGKVTEGMDIVDRMAGVKTTSFGPYGDVPAEDIVLVKAEVIE